MADPWGNLFPIGIIYHHQVRLPLLTGKQWSSRDQWLRGTSVNQRLIKAFTYAIRHKEAHESYMLESIKSNALRYSTREAEVQNMDMHVIKTQLFIVKMPQMMIPVPALLKYSTKQTLGNACRTCPVNLHSRQSGLEGHSKFRIAFDQTGFKDFQDKAGDLN